MELYRVESSKVFPFLDVFITLEVMVCIPLSISYEISWGRSFIFVMVVLTLSHNVSRHHNFC